MNRPEPALWITLVAVPVNAVLAYVLIFGAFGAPRLEIFGAGVATTFVNLGMCVAGFWVCYTQRPFKKFQVLGRFWRFDWPLLRRLIVVGAPIAGAFLIEYGLFAGAALMVGWIGTVELAAHQIALQIAAIVFMVPFGISMAATVRVGHAVGRNDPVGVRRAGQSAIVLGVLFMAAMVVIIIAFRGLIPRIFLDPGQGNSDATLAIAATLLSVGATFFIVDGIQTVVAGALRGLNDTRVPMLFAAASFWLVGLSVCYLLAFQTGLGVIGIWAGFTISIALYAALLVWRFNVLTRARYMPDLAHATR